jgi:hypothetical protein
MVTSTNEKKCAKHTSDLPAKSDMKELLTCNSFKLNEKLLQAVHPHIASFNTFINFFIPEMIKDLSPIYVDPLFNKQNDELNPFYTPSECKSMLLFFLVCSVPVIRFKNFNTSRDHR